METLTEQITETIETPQQSFAPLIADPLLAIEHYHRYLYASRFVKNKRVLDISCGEGYGTAFLSLNALEVVGVDRDESKVLRAKEKYARFANTKYETGECENYTAPASSFDVAVSLGTLQHLGIEERHRFLLNLKQVLKHSGVCVISAPVRPMNGKGSEPTAPTSKAKFSAVEFSEFLKQYFRNIIFVGQKALTVSSIWSLYDWADDNFRFHMRDDLFTLPPEDEQFANPDYLVAICSNEYLSREIADSSKSFYYDVAQVKQTENISAQKEELELKVTGLESDARALREQNDRHTLHEENLRDEIQQYRNQLHEMERKLLERDSTIEMLKNDLAASHASNETLQQAYDLRTARANTLKEEHASLTNQVQEMRSKSEEHIHIAKTTAEENEQFRKTILDLNDKLKERQIEIAKLQEEGQKQRAKVSDLDRQLSERNNALHRTMEEVAGLQTRLAHMENLSAEKSRNAVYAVEELQRTQEEAETFQQQIEQLRRDMEEMIAERDTLRTKNRELMEEQAHSSATVQQTDSEFRKLQERIAQLEMELNERTVKESKAASEQERLRRQVKELHQLADEKSAMAMSLQSELARVRAEFVELELEKEERSKTDVNLNDTVKEQTAFLMNLQRENDVQSAAIKQLKAELEKQITAFDTYQKTQADLQSRYNKSQIKVQELQATIGMLEKNIEKITKSGTYKVLANIGFMPKEK